jgi:hypothetical protein
MQAHNCRLASSRSETVSILTLTATQLSVKDYVTYKFMPEDGSGISVRNVARSRSATTQGVNIEIFTAVTVKSRAH